MSGRRRGVRSWLKGWVTGSHDFRWELGWSRRWRWSGGSVGGHHGWFWSGLRSGPGRRSWGRMRCWTICRERTWSRSRSFGGRGSTTRSAVGIAVRVVFFVVISTVSVELPSLIVLLVQSAVNAMTLSQKTSDHSREHACGGKLHCCVIASFLGLYSSLCVFRIPARLLLNYLFCQVVLSPRQ